MRRTFYPAVSLLVLLVFGCHKLPDAATASAVPLALWVDYSAADGDSYHFIRARDAHGEIRNEYCVNPDYDPEARYVAVDISAESWARFRRAVESVDFRGMKEAYEFRTIPGAVRWSIYLEYSDRVISASSVDSPTTIADFAKLKAALHELTKGGAFGIGKKAAEPGATDNPDDAERLREDH